MSTILMKIAAATLILFVPICCHAYKCVDNHGEVIYQDFMCELKGLTPYGEKPKPKPQPQPQKYFGEPISMNFTNVDVRQVFEVIAGVGNFRLVVDPAIKGTVELHYTNTPWDQILSELGEKYGLTYRVDGNVLHISALGLFQ